MRALALPSALETIGSDCFYECETLASINLPETLKNIGKYAFCRCYALTSINIPSADTIIGRYAYAYYYTKDAEGFGSFNIAPNTIYGAAGSTAEEYANGLNIDFVGN